MIKQLSLPPKIKGREYIVGCDCVHENGNEIFTYCVVYTEQGRVHVVHSESVLNEVKYQTEALFDIYVKQLSRYYNVEVFTNKK